MDKVVGVAVELGWSVAELYAKVLPENPLPPEPAPSEPRQPRQAPPLYNPRPKLPEDLPGRDDLHVVEERTLERDRIAVALRALRPAVRAAGLSLGNAPDLVSLGEDSTAEGRYRQALELRDFHVEVLTALRATDIRLGDSYGLGRALADVTLRVKPQSAALYLLRDDLRAGRVETLHNRLSSLKSALPDHAAGGVMASLEAWQKWAASETPSWLGSPVDYQGNMDTTSAAAASGLRVQGRKWREALTGEKDPLDNLSADDYVEAGGFLIGRMRHLLGYILRQYAVYLTVALVAIVALTVVALTLPPTETGKAFSAAVAVLGGLGLTTKGISSAFSRAVRDGEDFLWAAELDLAVARSITTSPDVAAFVGGEPPSNRLARSAAKRRAVVRMTLAKENQARRAPPARTGGPEQPVPGQPAPDQTAATVEIPRQVEPGANPPPGSVAGSPPG